MESLLDPEGCTDKSGGTLPEHLDKGLTRLEQAEDYAQHIGKISREYVPLSSAVLPERLQHALDNAVCSGHPSIDDCDVYKNLSERKLTGGVEGDLDPRVMRGVW